jgi:hypothetical protein
MKFIIAVILLLLATGIISYNNGTFHYSKPAADTAYENVKISATEAAHSVEKKKEEIIDKNSSDRNASNK